MPPVLLDLCSVAILHRFSSPNWWQHLIQHVPTDFSNTDAFDKVVKLQVSAGIILRSDCLIPMFRLGIPLSLHRQPSVYSLSGNKTVKRVTQNQKMRQDQKTKV